MSEKDQTGQPPPEMDDVALAVYDLLPPPEQPEDDVPESISWQITTLCLLFLCTAGILLALYLSDSRTAQDQDMDLALTSGVREADLSLIRFLGQLEQAATAIEYGVPKPEVDKETDSTHSKSIQEIMKKESAISEIVVTDRKGTIHHASLPQLVGKPFKHRKIALRKLRSDRSRMAVLVGPVQESLGRTSVMYVHLLQTRDRTIGGMVVLTFPTHAFTMRLATFRPNYPSGKIMLMDDELNILAHLPDRSADIVGSSRASLAPLVRFADSDRKSAILKFRSTPDEDDETIAAVRKASLLDLMIMAEVSRLDSSSGWKKEALALVLTFILFGGFISFFSIVLMRYSRTCIQRVEAQNTTINVLNRCHSLIKAGSWTASPDKNIIWSKEACQLLGYRTGTTGPIDMAAANAMEEDKKQLIDAFTKAQQGVPIDLVHRANDGMKDLWIHTRGELTCDTSGNLVRGIGILQNITDLKNKADDATDAQAILLNILESLPVPLWWLERNGTQRHFNRAWGAITGTRPDPMKLDEWTLAIHPEDRRAARSKTEEARTAKKASLLNFKVRSTDGSYRPMLCLLYPILDQDQNLQTMVAFYIEDTEENRYTLSAYEGLSMTEPLT